jgi:hypothetical protein
VTLGSSEFNSLVTFASNLVTVIEAGKELDDRPEVLKLVKHIRDEIEALREVRVIVVSNLRINADDLEAEGGSRRYRSEKYDIDRLYRISDVTIRRSDIQIDFEKMLGQGIPFEGGGEAQDSRLRSSRALLSIMRRCPNSDWNTLIRRMPVSSIGLSPRSMTSAR